MSKIAYTVKCTIADEEKAAVWLAWLRDRHMREVIAGGALAAELVRMDDPACSYEVRYIFPDRKAYDAYIRDHAPRLRAEGFKRFPPEDGFSYSRTVGEIVG